MSLDLDPKLYAPAFTSKHKNTPRHKDTDIQNTPYKIPKSTPKNRKINSKFTQPNSNQTSQEIEVESILATPVKGENLYSLGNAKENQDVYSFSHEA